MNANASGRGQWMLPERIYGRGDRRILSVEDDDAAFLLLDLGFEQVGADIALYRVKYGQDAVDFLQHRGRYVDVPKPNVLLLDLNIPRLNGLQVLEAIKADPDINDIPVVVFSGSSMDKDRAKCLALGARAFVTKPAELDQLLNVLRDVCSLL